ncbi:hypothetical protein BGW36DRAFT_456699 [Talaromyces proteolyticus]|uniref:Uncharacterized protein n=1 Tax=Talaromyces proteolyticus TaxID=1131652 RepID=A0AAD4L229_9EURO|nr:uncharacterized protein BGW36DRAFT_456699 [Talaromyces proteolyticus]KAH8705195.1 hypothetical protein BGW36DRAFT_456699 [Talaromyces proteolyticus]
MQFLTALTTLTTLLFTTLTLGAAIDTRDTNDLQQEVDNQLCSPKGSACGPTQGECCPTLNCFIPPRSGWEPAEYNFEQGAPNHPVASMTVLP